MSGCVGTLVDLSLDPVLVNYGMGVQLDSSNDHPSPEKALTNCGSIVSPNRLPMARHRHHLTWPALESLQNVSELIHPVSRFR